ncbi:MAG: tRNA lysidine(34) synthetase TilS [Yoonia sp.]|uniref:tRNA lysidine(34) synthetase TilS n=1 Tax=Yoonia sp. TaxID=2212373 RepID=UPI003EF96C82
MPVDTSILARFQDAIRDNGTGPIGLAVSGGGDSIAMLHLAVAALGAERLRVFSVNHGLRPQAAEELALVGQQAQALGVPHAVAHWAWDGQGNLQASARTGRWTALVELAQEHKVDTIWLGHTADDQIETFLMRLARGSGVDGLAAMRPATRRDGIPVLRPLLGLRREELRQYLRDHAIAWCDDPSNKDPRFDRIKARDMAARLEELGLTPKRVLQTIDHMQAAQRSLDAAATQFARAHVRQEAGDLILAPAAFDLGREDVPRRVFAAAIGWIGQQTQRPRFDSLRAAAASAQSAQATTLAGCVLAPQNDGSLRLMREAAATTPAAGSGSVVWDKRWRITGPATGVFTVKALGQAIADCPGWRETGHPRKSLLASPAIWIDDVFVAAPLAGLSNGWSAQIVADFHSGAFAIED